MVINRKASRSNSTVYSEDVEYEEFQQNAKNFLQEDQAMYELNMTSGVMQVLRL